MPNPSFQLVFTVRSVSDGYIGTVTPASTAAEVDAGGSVTIGFTLSPDVPAIGVDAVSALLASAELTADKKAVVFVAGDTPGTETVTVTIVVE